MIVLSNGLFGDFPFCDSFFNIYYHDGTQIMVMTPQLKEGDLNSLKGLCEEYRFEPQILEVGAYVGHSTCLWAMWAKQRHGHVTTIDTFVGNEGTINANPHFNTEELLKRNLKTWQVSDVVTIYKGTSASFPVRTWYGALKTYDIVFLDGGHKYSEIKADLEKFWPLVREGGILCGHDFNSKDWKEEHIEKDFVDGVHHGVTKALIERFPKNLMKHSHPNSSVWFVRKNVQG